MKRIVYRIQWVGYWRIQINGKPTRTQYLTQAEAVGDARRSARSDHAIGKLAQVVLHGKNGRIRWERTYGKDPKRRKG